MKSSLFLILLTLPSTSALSQDTISKVGMHYQHTFITIAHEGDTSIYVYRKDGSLESTRPKRDGVYTRYYPSGSILWTQERQDDQANGIMKFYTEKGKHVASLNFRNDSITDTLFVSAKYTILFGRYTYTSIIHGGMPRPDGSSNISEGTGPKVLAPLYLVKHNKLETPEIYNSFSVDYNGYFFSIVEKGSYGIFPQGFSLESVNNSMGAPDKSDRVSRTETWNSKAPIHIDENFCYLSLIVHSIGYAP